MNEILPIKTLFMDIGGVLLTNGWDHEARRRAAAQFKMNWADIEDHHRSNFAAYEEGKLKLEDYLNKTIYYQQRDFTRDQFMEFMLAQSQPFPLMIDWVRQLKLKYGLKIAVVSNEGRELNAYRIRKFKLDSFVDFFISSCFVHIRKPDAEIFRLALDISQTPANQIVYIDNTSLFVRIAQELGIKGIVHTEFSATCNQLASFGLNCDPALAN